MEKLPFYDDVLKCHTDDEVFNYLINSLKPSILAWTYFVNWDKVFQNTKKIEIALNNLNYLIGKENFDEEFKLLLEHNPSLARTIPALAVRDGNNNTKFKILVDYKSKKLLYEDYDFSKPTITNEDIEKYLKFIEKTGLKQLIQSQKIKNLVDYMIGVEAGLDSNGRKNRGGTAMESIVDWFIADYCRKNNFTYLKEANAAKIKSAWDIDVPVDKSSRRYDFVVNKGNELIIFEANFYSGGGSKLKSTAGEYRNLHDILNGKFKFVWITDGFGWHSTTRPLRETFNHIQFIFNLSMIENGVLDAL